jgi:hypothetical protein
VQDPRPAFSMVAEIMPPELVERFLCLCHGGF